MNIRSVKKKVVIGVQIYDDVHFNLNKQALHLLKQIRRLDTIKSCVAKAFGNRSVHGWSNNKDALQVEVKGNVNAFVNQYKKGDPAPESVEYFNAKGQDEHFSYFTVTKFAEEYRRHLDILRKAGDKSVRIRTNANKYI